ncbi:hypothetical protein PAMP_002458 [Pampus punctatissimus]
MKEAILTANEAKTVTGCNDFTLRRQEERALAISTDKGRFLISQQHLKMMRLLFLCLLLPSATVFSRECEGSADEDDEDICDRNVELVTKSDLVSVVGETKGSEDSSDQVTLIIIIVAVTVLTLSVATIITIMLVKHHSTKLQGVKFT